MNIWIVQYLCPQRHAIIAMPYNRDAIDSASVEVVALDLIATVIRLNPWCGICNSRDLRFEHGKLRFTDWDKAVEELRACEANQAATRALIDSLRNEAN